MNEERESLLRDFNRRLSSSTSLAGSYYGDIDLYINNASRIRAREKWDSMLREEKIRHLPVSTSAQLYSNTMSKHEYANLIRETTRQVALEEAVKKKSTSTPASGGGGGGTSSGTDDDDGSDNKGRNNKPSNDKSSVRLRNHSLLKIISLFSVAIGILKKISDFAVSTAKEAVERSMTATSLGVSEKEIRGYNIFDLYHGLKEGTSTGALAELGSAFLDIGNLNDAVISGLAVALGKDVDLEGDIKAMFGDKSLPEMLEEILNGFFNLYVEGRNHLGTTVGQSTAGAELTNFLRNTMGLGSVADLFTAMIRDYNTGNYGSFGDYTGWFNTTKAYQASDTLIDYLEAMGDNINKISAKFKSLADSISAEWLYKFSWLMDYIGNLRIGMSEQQSAQLSNYNKMQNSYRISELETQKAGLASSLRSFGARYGLQLTDDDIEDLLSGVRTDVTQAFFGATYTDNEYGNDARYVVARMMSLGKAIEELESENNKRTIGTVFASTDSALDYSAESIAQELEIEWSPLRRIAYREGDASNGYIGLSTLWGSSGPTLSKWNRFLDFETQNQLMNASANYLSTMGAMTEGRRTDSVFNALAKILNESGVAYGLHMPEIAFGKDGTMTEAGYATFKAMMASPDVQNNLGKYVALAFSNMLMDSKTSSEVLRYAYGASANDVFITKEGNETADTSATASLARATEAIQQDVSDEEFDKAFQTLLERQMYLYGRDNVSAGEKTTSLDVKTGKMQMAQDIYITLRDGSTRKATQTKVMNENKTEITYIDIP